MVLVTATSFVQKFDRLFKEHKSYILEEEQQKIKLDKFVANGAEDWDIKNAVRATLPLIVLLHR